MTMGKSSVPAAAKSRGIGLMDLGAFKFISFADCAMFFGSIGFVRVDRKAPRGVVASCLSKER
jgi:hypothetical protein